MKAAADRAERVERKSNRTGRPSIYSQKVADLICEKIADGESLRKICEDETMPNRQTVLNWLAKDDAFSARYARAREIQGDAMDERILEVADACTPETAQADRVKIMAYQWRASKLAPKKYGEKVTLEGGETPISTVTRVELVAPKR
ncbi:MAG: hypothetical protein LCH88_09110 [Proteobacteria bacterium]|nr:hypothetical protein [Pseudomonadota bacterium]